MGEYFLIRFFWVVKVVGLGQVLFLGEVLEGGGCYNFEYVVDFDFGFWIFFFIYYFKSLKYNIEVYYFWRVVVLNCFCYF